MYRLTTAEAVHDLEEELEAVQFSPSEYAAVQAFLLFLRAEKCRRSYIQGGGIGVEGSCTWSLLQIDAEVDDAGRMDFVASFLLLQPYNDVKIVAAARKQNALNLMGLYWRHHPNAPVLLPQEDDGYGYLLCGLEGEGETWAPVSLSQQRALERHAASYCAEDARVAYAKPRPQQPSARHTIHGAGGGGGGKESADEASFPS